ncbi:hypothetical protein AGR2A_pa40051 [Agrobacterium genomosp. 2 str. CFBP 5494]|uniref:Uncharacterized protein n=1 Tax=Agrobacterium genomosp. 2 str. CFBP 5494 TaxID=1183436 RepID=A0A9W5B6N7_9HYPH|nr:hypothetical protein AGR2A_pa40051 [Agrobacterium genomosp. 2 str. CFBP 5494]
MTIAFILVEQCEISIGELPNHAPGVVVILRRERRDAATAFFRSPGKTKDMVSQITQADELRIGATLHHLSRVHVGPVCEVEHAVSFSC